MIILSMDQFIPGDIPTSKEMLLKLTDEEVIYWANSEYSISESAVKIILIRYENLIRSIVFSQRDLRYTEEDKKDVRSAVYVHFLIRIRKYKHEKKVPFAGYIKRMVTQDVMNDYGGKKNALGNIGLRSSFCRKWANEINFTDYINRICGDEYDIDDLDIVLRNANSEFNKKADIEYKKVEAENDLGKFWVEVRRILSKKKFLVLNYYYKEGLNEREIGELLKIRQNTVSGHKTDAENRLKKSRVLKNRFSFKNFFS